MGNLTKAGIVTIALIVILTTVTLAITKNQVRAHEQVASDAFLQYTLSQNSKQIDTAPTEDTPQTEAEQLELILQHNAPKKN